MASRQPLVYNQASGKPAQIPVGDTIDPTWLPPTTGSRTFAYWSG